LRLMKSSAPNNRWKMNSRRHSPRLTQLSRMSLFASYFASAMHC
jgi:hypothetical protein